ncbi:NAD(P)-binding Rossmann-fold superfamily protein, putative [Theobroma cacao]|uniref:NAD(P)-binding Rossmann-fold superfamily protein, putative n=1 Tax=Theobroma cacao TaxID=3641 RepID=A0A061GWS8_THECC|nr:NAD(P)-binding Rossmann-fold superfamily protein, putative [Theobroma cacao]
MFHPGAQREKLVINNVGVYLWKPTVEFTAEEFSTLTSANFESASHLCQFSHPLDLKARGAGSVVFISSMAAVISINIGGSFYSAAKGALNQLTKTLACEWAKDNLRTNCVAPAFIRTPLTKAAFEEEKMSEICNLKNSFGTDWRA